jgi:deoxyadenosine/deoxycytidine kinase
MSTSSTLIVSIEGNIGAGKSTLLKCIRKRYPDIKVIDEPVDTWEKLTTSDGKNILQHFYGDMDRWAYTFQNAAILTRILNMKDAIRKYTGNNVFITERSYLTDKYVFAKMLHDDGKLNDLEMKLYDTWYNNFTKDLPIHTILWLPTDPSTCLDRIHIRNRPGEEHIPLDYLKRLDETHEQWLNNASETHPNVIKVELGLSAEEICERYIDKLYYSHKSCEIDIERSGADPLRH